MTFNFKDHARFELERTRWLTEQHLDRLEKEDDWFYQPHPQANHAAWVAGHLGLADNRFTSRFRPDYADDRPDWHERLWFGSEISGDKSLFPAITELRSYMRDRRETLLKVLDEATDEELAADAPPPDAFGPLAGAPCIGHAFLFIARHESIHFGQLSVASRGLGLAPLFSPNG
ncbi:MAG: DinB family protein [Planctomycetota bacterium]